MKLLIIAPGGKMGRLVTREALLRPAEFTIVGGVERAGLPCIGQDLGVAAGTAAVGAATYDDIGAIIDAADGVIDFSTVDSSMNTLRVCRAHRKALVIGTTGFSPEQVAQIRDAAAEIPILLAANMSKSVNLLYELVGKVSEVFGGEADIEIIEMHDRDKADAPSGTAREFGAVVADKLGQKLTDIADFGRSGRREPGHIGYHSVRAGNISSSHTILFGLMGERIELTHHAYDFTTFARGALDGLLYIAAQPPGLYSFRDVLGLA